MKLSITRQDSNSRGELLLRSFFGWLYIMIPHAFVMMFVSIWAGILQFLAFWVVLFTGKYPESWFEFQVKMMNWSTRLQATMLNLVDGYPAIGVNGESDKVSVEVENPDSISRGLLLLRLFFGAFYVGIPHGFMLCFRMIGHQFVAFIAWWAILFTGKFPEKMHGFLVGTIRWQLNVSLYMGYMSDDYPPFTGKE
ncbi:MAG: DUF4389 domain-containing protein [Spirochaetales bacterium]|nr:DUF4389 domain-containing protein [Spirochaetales bacterium]